jgi:hypothetical protein
MKDFKRGFILTSCTVAFRQETTSDRWKRTDMTLIMIINRNTGRVASNWARDRSVGLYRIAHRRSFVMLFRILQSLTILSIPIV